MSLKAKLEAVIYAAEEPVTLTQLATIFAGEALEWRAAQQAAAAEQTAEVVNPAQSLPLLNAVTDQDAAFADETAESAAADEAAGEAHREDAPVPQADGSTQEAAETAAPGPESPVPEPAEAGTDDTPAPGDPEADARREARHRDRDIKAVLKHLLDELVAESAIDDRGVEIREIAGGYRMATKPECHDAVRLFVKSLKPPLKLSLPALETLAVVAYKQPVTAPEVSEIRGVESGGVLGSLLARKLIATAGRKQVIGRPILYKTTKEFLLRFGLKDVAELPSMEEFEKMAAAEIEEMEPEAVAADAAEDAAEEAAEQEEALAEEGETLAASEPSGEEMAVASELQEPAAQSAEPHAAAESAQSAAPEDARAEDAATDNEDSASQHEGKEAAPHAEDIQEER